MLNTHTFQEIHSFTEILLTFLMLLEQLLKSLLILLSEDVNIKNVIFIIITNIYYIYCITGR